MTIAPDFKDLLPRRSDDDDRPVYYLWTFDPSDGKVYLDHNEKRHPADAVTHKTLAPHVTHPDTMHGFAYSIKDGWRITNDEHNVIDDPYITRMVLKAIRHEHPPPPLPHIRYHGAP